jgi:hypothetical protein
MTAKRLLQSGAKRSSPVGKTPSTRTISFSPTPRAPFGLVIYAKRLDALARAAIVEAVRLDTQEAPQRESERKKKNEAATRAEQAKARRANKVPFRP